MFLALLMQYYFLSSQLLCLKCRGVTIQNTLVTVKLIHFFLDPLNEHKTEQNSSITDNK